MFTCPYHPPGHRTMPSCAIFFFVIILMVTGCANPKDKRPWLGVNTFMGRGIGPDRWESVPATPRDREIDFLLINELGAPRIRDLVMCWAAAQPASGAAYDFNLADDIVRRAQDADVDLLAQCWVIPAWAADAAEGATSFDLPARKHEKAFVDYVRAFVDRYNGDHKNDMPKLKQPLRAYEFMDRIEDYPTEEYAWWLKRFYRAVHETDAEAIVVLGGLDSPGLHTFNRPEGDYPTWFERLLAEPELQGPDYPYFDVTGFHHFPERYPGRQPFGHAVGYLKQTMAKHGVNRPIWLTEFGYNSGAREESPQADALIPWTLRARAMGVERAYVYCLRDYRLPGESGPGQNFGLVREAASGQVPTKKPAFQAMHQLLLELADRPRVTRQADGLYKLTGKGEPTYVLWKKDIGYDPSGVLIPGWWEVRTVTGRVTVRQGTEIELSSTPLFLRKVASPFLY